MVNGCSSVIALGIAMFGLIALTGATVDADKMVAKGLMTPDEQGAMALFALFLFVGGGALWIYLGWASDDPDKDKL